MKKQKTFFVSRKNWLTVLALLVLLSSAVILLVQFGSAGTLSKNTGRLCLFVGSQLLLAGIVLFHGQEFFFRSVIPVWIWCLAEVLTIYPHSSTRQKAGFLILYACIAIVYTALTSGKLSKKYGFGGLFVCTALLIFFRRVPAMDQMLPTLLMIVFEIARLALRPMCRFSTVLFITGNPPHS